MSNRSKVILLLVRPAYRFWRSKNVLRSVTKIHFLSHVSNNFCKTNLAVRHNMCLTCPPPVWPTHVLSLFVKPFWWVSRANLPIPSAMRLQISYRFWLSLQLVEFLIVQRAHNLNFKLNYLRYDFKNRFLMLYCVTRF